ncbi:protein SPT2 homolog isoform X2 [Varanus komodoensis]|uniref:protein SPT2 homolog isoform X2 n=1 Tax=Varanus komodoensis TaxID=61221 RepID=UPI001CF7C3BA|nr:protein SPT2 homolog isoform X2 [Varanus komodoensis]
MEFRQILMVASEQQGLSSVPKRYSLAVGPPKKDPKVKGVQSAAVRAFLKRQEEEQKKKALEEKRRKEGLLARRVELKHDRKARAMASRTKDNFRGYNGIPVEEKPKKRQGASGSEKNIEINECTTGDEMEQFEYSQIESEPESEEYEEKPSKTPVRPKAPPKSGPATMNFNDLLKLAEKKQYEPVEIKVVKKTEERPMTAEELREREFLERKNRKGAVLKEKKLEKETRHVSALSSSKKDIVQKESTNATLSKHGTDKHSFSKGGHSLQSGIDKRTKVPALSEKPSKLSSSSKPNHIEKAKPPPKGPLKSPSNSSHMKLASSGGGKSGSGSHTPVLKTAANGTLRQSSSKEPAQKKAISHSKSASMAAMPHEGIRTSSSKQTSSSSVAGGTLPRAKSNLNTGPGQPSSSLIASHGSQGIGPGRSGSSSGTGQRSSSSSTGPGRPSNSLAMGPGRPANSLAMGPGRPANSLGRGSGRPGGSSGSVHSGNSQSIGPGRPTSSLNTGLGRGSSSGSGPGRPGNTSVGTPKPKCTVVSETISSKNLVPRQMNGMRPLPQQRPGIHPQGFPRPSLPPITYKRHYEDDDDYDSEMEDFIEDEGEPQEEISKHIKEIFGYDRNRYKDESDYALRYMESSWKEQQKEEARSLKLGLQEDLEEMRREEEELKRKKQAKKLRTR